jgi:hypothetical protein
MLDAEKAFDVVDHIHLFWKLYHQGITGSTWLLIDFFENYNRHTHSRSHTRSYTRRGKCIVGNISKRKR